jgi:hypothetical protein
MWQFNVVLLYIRNKQNAYNPYPNDTEGGTKENHDYLNQDTRPVGCWTAISSWRFQIFTAVAISNALLQIWHRTYWYMGSDAGQ